MIQSPKQKKLLMVVLALAALLVAAALAYTPLQKLYRKIAKQPDQNGMYQVGDHWFQALEPLSEQSAQKFADKLLSVQQNYLTEQNRIFWAIVPDKGWYVEKEGYPTLNHPLLQSQLEALLTDFTSIDLTPALSLDSYYKSDRHWRQEALQPVLDLLGEKMGFSVSLNEFDQQTVPAFHGDFSKHITGKFPQEDLIYLTNSDTDQTVVDNYQAKDVHSVYDLPRLESKLPYDVFLSGVTPIVTLKSPNAPAGKELVIFRDSFASSLAPLLCGEYQTITLIDLRFMHSSLIPKHITFTNQDVLFLYSDWIASNPSLLK